MRPTLDGAHPTARRRGLRRAGYHCDAVSVDGVHDAVSRIWRGHAHAAVAIVVCATVAFRRIFDGIHIDGCRRHYFGIGALRH